MTVLAEAQACEARGDLVEARRLYLEAGALKEAARLSWSLGALDEAAELSERGGFFYETALCHIEMGDVGRALFFLVRSSPDDENYRDAARRAIAAAGATNQMDMRLDRFLSTWLESAPQSEDEVDALIQLADIYEMHAMNEAAHDALRLAAGARPDDKRIARRLSRSGDLPVVLAATDISEEMGFRRARWMGAEEDEESGPGALLEPGARIQDRWVLEDVIGRGGMAVVFRARDLELGQAVAIKVFTQVVKDEDAEARFRREASLSRTLTHRNVIRVYDIGKVHGHSFITMELLSGYDLDTYLVPGVPFEIDTGVRYLIQACAGLQHAHEHGVVHRDVKPANFFVGDTGVLKVMDFGIARHTRGEEPRKVTETGMILGTPEYISPEQITDFANTGPSTDLYALGVILYQLLCGRVPFVSEKPVDVLMAHIDKKPVPPRSYNPMIPAALDEIVLRLLQKRPQDRFASAREVALQLKDTLSR